MNCSDCGQKHTLNSRYTSLIFYIPKRVQINQSVVNFLFWVDFCHSLAIVCRESKTFNDAPSRSMFSGSAWPILHCSYSK